MPKKAKLTIHPAFRIGAISKRLYGAFLEPIGSMVNGTMYNPKHPTAGRVQATLQPLSWNVIRLKKA